MTFGPRNTYYLRISRNVVLPLSLYLDERHIDWMSDIVLQHVLSDLRPLVLPKLQAEKDVHFGLGAAPGNKRGTVEVHRGESYQFAYFFRKTEPHTVLFKSRYFVTAPLRSASAPEVTSAPQNLQNEMLGARVSAKQSKRKRTESKIKGKSSRRHLDEDEWFAQESDTHTNDANPITRELGPLRKQRRIIAGTYQEHGDDNTENMRQDVTVHSPPPDTDTESGGNLGVEEVDHASSAVQVRGATWDLDDSSSGAPDVELVAEEEETKPKPLLKLKYQSFSITGHCLCVVVEPWPSLRVEPRPAPLQRGGSNGSTILPTVKTVIVGQRTETPLFFPDYDRAPSDAPFADDHDDSDNDLMDFSQTLSAAGHLHAIAADEDDDMDGAVLFGDADEVRELF